MNTEKQLWATVGRGRGGDYAWFDPKSAVSHAWGRHLPHWRQTGALYFVTFRTSDSIPEQVLIAWQCERDQWLAAHPSPRNEQAEHEYHQRFTARLHRFLDDCHGKCPFRDASLREMMASVLHYGDGTDYALDLFVVMPNHVHALVCPSGEAELNAVTKKWKTVSAHRVNRLLGLSGSLWQHESWDHSVRSSEHLDGYRRYIEANPGKMSQQQ